MLLALREIVSVDQDLPLQVGVNWGPVFAGEIGPRYRRTYTVMGDTVNLAARLMAKAPVREVLATREVLEGSRTLFETTELEPFLVKGKKLPVQAFAVGDPTGSRGAADVATPLVGRDRELEILDDGVGVGGSLEGPTGRTGGRTRHGKDPPAAGVPAAVGRLPHHPGGMPPLPGGHPLLPVPGPSPPGPRPGGTGPEGDRSTSWRSRVMEAAPESGALAGVDRGGAERRDRTLTRGRATRRSVSTGPHAGRGRRACSKRWSLPATLIVIEDTHWMDDASRELLAGLLFGLERQPWMIILTRRPGEGGFVAPESSQVARIELQPLTQTQAETLINSATADHPLLPSQVTALAERAAGNPLFLVELLRSLKSGSDVDSLRIRSKG